MIRLNRINRIPVYFSPVYIYFGLMAYYFLIPMIVDDAASFDWMVVLVLFLGTTFFLLAYHGAPRVHASMNLDSGLCKTLALIVLSIDFVSVVGDILSPYSRLGTYAMTYKNIGLLEIMYGNVWAVTKTILYAFLFRYKKLFSIVLLVQFINAIYSDVRINFLIFLLLFIFFLHYHGLFKITVLRSFLALMSMPFLFAILLYKRVLRYGSDNQDIDFFSLANNVISSLNGQFKSKDLLMAALESPQSYRDFWQILHGEINYYYDAFIRVIWNFVPRSLYQEKPEALSRIVAKLLHPDAYNQGAGFGVTVFGEGWLALGPIGVVLTLLMFGFIAGIVRNFIWSHHSISRRQYAFYIAIYPYIIFSIFVQYFRGFFWERLWQAGLIFVLLLSFSWLSRVGAIRSNQVGPDYPVSKG